MKSQRAPTCVRRADQAERPAAFGSAESLLLVTDLELYLYLPRPQADLKDMGPIAARGVGLAVTNVLARGHAVKLTRLNDAGATMRVFVRERTLTDVRDNLGVAVGVVSHRRAGRQSIFVEKLEIAEPVREWVAAILWVEREPNALLAAPVVVALVCSSQRDHEMPSCIPPDVSSFARVAISASVVSINDATEAAFCSATRTTLVGSMTPATTRSSYTPVATL